MRLVFHWFILIGGTLALLVGILGLFLPIVPGLLMIFLGLIILGSKSKLTSWIVGKFPEPVKKYFEIAENKLNPTSIILLIILTFVFIGLLFYYFLQFKY